MGVGVAFVCFVVLNPRLFLANKVDFGLKFSIFTLLSFFSLNGQYMPELAMSLNYIGGLGMAKVRGLYV